MHASITRHSGPAPVTQEDEIVSPAANLNEFSGIATGTPHHQRTIDRAANAAELNAFGKNFMDWLEMLESDSWQETYLERKKKQIADYLEQLARDIQSIIDGGDVNSEQHAYLYSTYVEQEEKLNNIALDENDFAQKDRDIARMHQEGGMITALHETLNDDLSIDALALFQEKGVIQWMAEVFTVEKTDTHLTLNDHQTGDIFKINKSEVICEGNPTDFSPRTALKAAMLAVLDVDMHTNYVSLSGTPYERTMLQLSLDSVSQKTEMSIVISGRVPEQDMDLEAVLNFNNYMSAITDEQGVINLEKINTVKPAGTTLPTVFTRQHIAPPPLSARQRIAEFFSPRP